ncbi:hypothetical protein MRX96_028269 [Rhipicephalus microplus]
MEALAVTLESYSGHVYTHCGHPKHEFYCSAYRKNSVLAAKDPVHVCNHDFKWFSSIKSCLASCVNGRHVSDRCYGSTLFFPCTRDEHCSSQTGFLSTCAPPGGDLAGLRCLRFEALEGISFLSDEVFQLREENERLHKDHFRGVEQQARVVASLRAVVRFLRDELTRRTAAVAVTAPGTCWSVGRRGVYRSWEERCRRCVLRTESECDETPAAETGSPRQLRHPYFADMQALGGARCVNVTRRALNRTAF